LAGPTGQKGKMAWLKPLKRWRAGGRIHYLGVPEWQES